MLNVPMPAPVVMRIVAVVVLSTFCAAIVAVVVPVTEFVTVKGVPLWATQVKLDDHPPTTSSTHAEWFR